MYEILLSFGENFVSSGSELFFGIFGSGKLGSNLFQFLGTVPQVVMVLVSALSGSDEDAQQRAKLGVGLVAGTAAMLLTLLWGLCVVFGSKDLSESGVPPNQSEPQRAKSKGYGVVTDYETRYTVWIISATLVPFLVILFSDICSTSHGKRVVILIALIIAVTELVVYSLYEIIRPQVKDQVYGYFMFKYSKDKLLKRLFGNNGKPPMENMLDLFSEIDVNKDQSISASELRNYVLELHPTTSAEAEDGLNTNMMSVENKVLTYFDAAGDHRISITEFINGLARLQAAQGDHRILPSHTIETTVDNDLKKMLVDRSNRMMTRSSQRGAIAPSWENCLKAFAFVIFGTAMLCILSDPLIESVVSFSQVANFSSFTISYLVIPFALNYSVIIQSITSARDRNKESISATLSALYSSVYMNNVVGLIALLAPEYARNLSVNVFVEVLIVLVICAVMTLIGSFRTMFPRWLGCAVIMLYPISLVSMYVATSVLGWG